MTNKTTEVRDALHPEYVRNVSQSRDPLEEFSGLMSYVMNLPCRLQDRDFANQTDRLNYKTGHRDARHDAVDLIAEFASRFRAQGGNTSESINSTAANKAEVEEDPLVTVSRNVDGNLKFTPLRDFHVTDGMGLFAAPPATTGASTARDQALEVAARLSEEMYKSGEGGAGTKEAAVRIRALKGSPPASTVLTDERIEKLRLIAAGSMNKNGQEALEHWIKGNREVAAQAGQVAVPEWISVDERLPENHKDVIILHWPYDNHENERVANTAYHVDGVFYDEDGNDMHPPSHWMPFVIPEDAPSPAKESK